MSLKDQKHLVVGLGQIGSAVRTILAEKYDVTGIDAKDSVGGKFDVLHICIPGGLPDFDGIVRKYQKQYLAGGGLTVIHATVSLGTSDRLGAVHSPVRGIHPDLVGGIKTFVKYFGGSRADEAAKIFADLGITTKTAAKALDTEAGKLWDTTQYGWNIVLEKLIKKWCAENGVDFDLVYSDFNKTYNEGYEKLGHPEYKKYILKHHDGKIGGHCVLQNCDLMDNAITEFIKKENEGF